MSPEIKRPKQTNLVDMLGKTTLDDVRTPKTSSIESKLNSTKFDDIVKKVAEKVDTTDPEELLFAKLPVLHKIVNATEILPETKQEIVDLLRKKKLTKKDRGYIEDILVNLYVNNEMFKADKPAVKESKIAEIVQLLDSI
jgi:hypothetical protein